MKVLRTALFSAFLTICLINVGHSQQIYNPIHQIQQPLTAATPDIEIELITAVVVPNSQYVVVKYNVVAPYNSTTTINEQGNTTILYTETLSGSSIVTAVFEMDTSSDENIGKLFECHVCDDISSNCRVMPCVAATDTNIDDGG